MLAGPGSGKTRIIVERFHRLPALGIGAQQQLVLTYTRKAADEMRVRVERAHGGFADDAPLTNYHSFALRVVREWGWLLGISPVLRIADAAERWLHVEAVLDELRPTLLWNPLRPHDLMDPLLDIIGTAKQELVTPDAYAAWAAVRLETSEDPAERIVLERHADVARVYARLDERYRRAGVFDFDDCILYAERLIREHPAARSAIADRITHVMVDEYQDTNYAQAKLVETLVSGHRNLFVVADDDQSIYKFRGASRANLDRFSREYPEHRQLVLTHNYRSTEQIVTASRAVIYGRQPGDAHREAPRRRSRPGSCRRGVAGARRTQRGDGGRARVRAAHRRRHPTRPTSRGSSASTSTCSRRCARSASAACRTRWPAAADSSRNARSRMRWRCSPPSMIPRTARRCSVA